jgi:hypothetical protein
MLTGNAVPDNLVLKSIASSIIYPSKNPISQ